MQPDQVETTARYYNDVFVPLGGVTPMSALMESAMRFSRASTCVTSASTSSPIL